MAKRRGSRPTRTLSPRELIAAAPLAVITAVAFAVAMQVSVAGEFRTRAPQLALRFVPVDGEARARLAGSLAANSPLPEARQAARDLAHDAIRRDPLGPVAMRALALARATEGSAWTDQAEAAKLFRQAERLSRRDQVTQLWLAEYHLRRDQIPRVMRHFDIALRTSAQGQDTLFPLLATAAADRRVAEALVARMRDRPYWALPFAYHLIGGQSSPETISYIFRNTLDIERPDELALVVRMMQRLADTGEYRLAWLLYDHFDLDRGNGRDLLNDGGFDSGNGIPPFAWSLVQEPNLWAAPEPQPGGGNALILSASSGKSGNLARQLVQLPSGTYRVSAKFGNVPRVAYQRPTLSVRCAENGEPALVTLRPAGSSSNEERIGAHFSVPNRCSFQWVVVLLAGPEAEAVDPPWIDDVAITRVAS